MIAGSCPNTCSPRHAGPRRGSALVASLVAVLAMSVLCAGLLQMSTRVTREQHTGIDDLAALYIAEAGLTESYNALSQGKDGTVGSEETPARFANGVYWVEVDNLGGGRVVLHSTGLVGAGRRSLEMVVEAKEVSMASLGVFGDEQVELGAGATIDWYDSGLGTYAEQQGGGGAAAGKVGSNGGITIGASGSVDGDVTPGSDFAVDLGVGATVTGSTAPGSELTTMEAISPPEMKSQGNLAVSGSQVLAEGAYRYGSVSVPAGSTLTLTGPLELVLDSLDVQSSGSLAFDSSAGPVVVYVLGDTVLASGSTLTSVDDDPTQVSVYLLGDNVTPLAGDVDTQGTDGQTGGLLQEGGFSPMQLGLVQGTTGGGTATTLTGALSSWGTDWTSTWQDYGWIPIGTAEAEVEHTIQLAATGDFFGFVYAPFSTLSLPSSLHVHGGAVARRVDLGDGATLSLDERLLAGTAAGDLAIEIVSWSVDALPPSDLVKSRLDPMVQLAAAGVVPLDSADAHNQKSFQITYRDLSGITRTFMGVEEMFNWAAVDQVLDIYREGEVATDPWPKVAANALIPSTSERQTSGTAFYWGRGAGDDDQGQDGSLLQEAIETAQNIVSPP